MDYWKYIKQQIKFELDKPQVSIYEKILFIRAILDDFEKRLKNGKY